VKQALPAAAGSIDLSLRPSYNPALKRLIGNAKPRIAGVFSELGGKKSISDLGKSRDQNNSRE